MMVIHAYWLILFEVLTFSIGKKADFQRVCYYTLEDPAPSKLNATLCTHIIAGFSSVLNGQLYLGNVISKLKYLETTQLKEKFPQLKVMLSVGGGGNDNGFSNAFNSSANRTRFISSVISTLKDFNFDGLDVDWEFPVWNDNFQGDKQNFISFLKEFKNTQKYFSKTHNPYLISVAVAAPKTIIDKSYDIPQLAKYVDFINLMSYDFHDYTWYTPFTGYNSPLFNRTIEHAYFATLNTAWSAYYWNGGGMPKSKIIIGIPTYAHTYKLIDSKYHSVDDPASGSGMGGGDINFYDVCNFLSAGGTRVFDPESLVPYAFHGYDWISYEDYTSAYMKSKWVKSQGFGGVMTYKLNSDDWMGICDGKTLFPLHQIIYQVLTS